MKYVESDWFLGIKLAERLRKRGMSVKRIWTEARTVPPRSPSGLEVLRGIRDYCEHMERIGS